MMNFIFFNFIQKNYNSSTMFIPINQQNKLMPTSRGIINIHTDIALFGLVENRKRTSRPNKC